MTKITKNISSLIKEQFGERVVQGIPIPSTGTGLGPERASFSNQPQGKTDEQQEDYGDLLQDVTREDIRGARYGDQER